MTSRRPFASKLGLLCLAWSGGCFEGVSEGVWERHDVGRIFLRFDFSEFLVETAENRSIFVFRCVSIFFDEPIYPSVIQLRLDLTPPKQPDSNGDFCRVTDDIGV